MKLCLFPRLVPIACCVWLTWCASPPASAQRLANLSTRTLVGTGAAAPIIGFVVSGLGPQQVLIRGAGPALSSFGLSGLLANPRLEVFDATSKSIASNDNWTTASVGGATTFASVGAFAFSSGSLDAALAVTLPPGNYTAKLTGNTATATGLALVEVYDLTGPSQLINLSTRSQVGAGANILIAGVVVAPGNGARKLLVRGGGPALSAFGLTGWLADPVITLTTSAGAVIATNDNWSSANAAAITAAGDRTGAFAFAAGSADAAMIVDLAPGNYTVQVTGAANGTGLALLEVYDLTSAANSTVSVATSIATTDTLGAPPAVYTFTRTGPVTAPLTVYFNTGGSALNGVDYLQLGSSVTIPAGAASVSVQLIPYVRDVSTGITPNKLATLSIVPGPDYSVAAANTASATIFFNPGFLYTSSLRVPAGVTGTTAAGSATLQLSADGLYAVIDVNFSGLSSPQTVSYLRLGDQSQGAIDLVRLPNGQVNGFTWTIDAAGGLTADQVRQAIKDGRVFVAIETVNVPSGELRGAFVRSSGSIVFVPPAAPPALANTPLTSSEAARFLTQATFGPRRADIDALTGKTLAGLDAWITAQIAAPISSHDAATDADYELFVKPTLTQTISQSNRQIAWWKIAVDGPDQLRQRVAFALSEIFVVSEVNNATLAALPSAMASYYDVLGRNALGNFRTLLEEVTLSPVMGLYLSHLRNAKATFNAQGVQVTFPDENYAREVMQLFTVGLNQLHPDGSLQLDPAGAPIPTYNQQMLGDMAKVFTGWAYASTAATPSFTGAAPNYLRPMMLYPAFHDDTAKTLLGGRQLPAGQGGAQDLQDALDTLFQHPNTGPFISRQLIQRLVTSNPSPGYIYRVAQVFANNGRGVRGDLSAVVRAILLDYEARSPSVAESASFGKLREPLVRVAAMLRSLGGTSNSGRIPFTATNTDPLLQTPLRAPTVFNFFEPDFVQPGSLANSGLYAPEYQILNDTTAIAVPNFLWTYLYSTRPVATDTDSQTVGIRFDAALLALAATPQALVDQLNLSLTGGGLPKATTDRIVTLVGALPAATSDANRLERVRSAAYLLTTAPQSAIQK